MKRFLRYIKEAELGFPGDESDKLYYSGGKEVKPKMSVEDEEHWSQHSLMPQPNEPGTNKSRYNVGHLRQLANMHPENHPNRLHFERKYGHLADTVTASPDQHPMDLEMDFHMLARSTRRLKPGFDAARGAKQAIIGSALNLSLTAKSDPREGPVMHYNSAEKIGKLINEIFEFDMDSVRHDGDLAHYHSHLDRLAYQHGVATRHLDKIRDEDPVDRSGRKRRAEDRVERIGEQFREVAGMANVAGHDPHKQGHSAFRNTGSLDPRFYKDTSHIDERSRQNAFDSDPHAGERHTATRNDRESLIRFGNKPGPWHMGYATHDLSIR